MNHYSGAAVDLWKNTLSRIETRFGRIRYLASLRNPDTGRYEHFGFEQHVGPEESERTLRASHEEVFAEWLGLNLASQRQELLAWLEDLEGGPVETVRSWSHVQPFATWVPMNARAVERELFLSDLDVLLESVRREFGVSLPDPDA